MDNVAGRWMVQKGSQLLASNSKASWPAQRRANSHGKSDAASQRKCSPSLPEGELLLNMIVEV